MIADEDSRSVSLCLCNEHCLAFPFQQSDLGIERKQREISGPLFWLSLWIQAHLQPFMCNEGSLPV